MFKLQKLLKRTAGTSEEEAIADIQSEVRLNGDNGSFPTAAVLCEVGTRHT